MAVPTTAPPQPTSHALTEPNPWIPKLKLQPLEPNNLPPHPDLASHQPSPPSLLFFLQNLYTEVHRHFDIPSTDIGTSKNSVTSRGTAYPVVVYKTKCKDDEGLLWCGRRSEHEEGKPVGYEELREVLMVQHEKNEAEYTPAVYEVNVLVDWEGDLKGDIFEWDGGRMESVEMRVTQMHHKMPGIGLNDRVFTILLLSFINKSSPVPESIDLQIPIGLSSFPSSVLSRSHTHANLVSTPNAKLEYLNQDVNATSEQKSRNGKDVVEGMYVSWERIKKVDGSKTEWVMRTASDAGGVLPGWVQRLGVPGAIAKDVPLAVRFAVEKGGRNA